MKFHSHRYWIPTAIARDEIVIKLLDSIWPIDFTAFSQWQGNYLAKMYALLDYGEDIILTTKNSDRNLLKVIKFLQFKF